MLSIFSECHDGFGFVWSDVLRNPPYYYHVWSPYVAFDVTADKMPRRRRLHLICPEGFVGTARQWFIVFLFQITSSRSYLL